MNKEIGMRVYYYQDPWDEPTRINDIHDIFVQEDGQVVVTTSDWKRITLRPKVDFVMLSVDKYDEK